MIDTYRTAREMAEKLTSYMKDDRAVQRAVVAEFGTRLPLGVIAKIRDQVFRAKVRFSRDGWRKNKNEGLSLESEIVHGAMMRKGSAALHKAIWKSHHQIMRNYQAAGLNVVRIEKKNG